MTIQTLRQTISKRFSLSDIRTLCFDLSVDFEEFGGGGKSDVIIQLVDYFERINRLNDLQYYFEQMRPFEPWADLMATLQSGSDSTTSSPDTPSMNVGRDSYGAIQGNQGSVTQNFNFDAPNNDPSKIDKQNFEKAKTLMPTLLAEMKKGLQETPTFRQFILKGEKWIYNSDGNDYLFYTYEAHENLHDKVIILENMGFVQDVAFNDVPRYRLQENFVDLLLQD